jgi:amino acid adenylation domain-containing protein
LGGYLNHIGVKKEDVVAVMLPRNINFVIAAIATMKAGGSFFPIDINNPIERIEYLLEDSKAKVLIKEDNIKISLREESIKDSNICVVDIEKDGFMDTDFPLTQEIKPENVAYTISTSGSTGRPKIISVEHRSLLNMCFYSIDQINITENDICGVYLSFSFDAVMKQIFPYLLKGATVSIMSEEAKFNEFTVNEFCEENDVTVLALPSALAKLFIKNCNNQSLRVLQAGGEKLNGYKKRKYKLYNEYGPAEFTVLSTQFLVDKEYNRIPIGKPIANTYVYVLDKYDNLCPIGVPGELCLSGAQISRGYINKKEATEKSFVDNPFCIDVYTKKMYRSGDLVTWLETGELDYIGRLDNQIKIGENNIDLYEIDNMISNINQIKSCITIAKEDEKGIKYLSSYYVIDEKDYEKINSTYIRNYLKLHLPSYMIPSVIIRIEKIPVTLIGKVNKRALN